MDCLGRALSNAEQMLGTILFNAQLWNKINQNPTSEKPVNERQRLIINRILGPDFKGYINTSKYAKLANCSNNTALRDIQDLTARHVLIKNTRGGEGVPAIS